MNNKILKVLCSVTLAVLMLASLAFAGLVWFGPLDGAGMDTPGGLRDVPVFTDLLMVWMYIMLAFIAVVTLVLAIVKFVKNFIESPKKAMKPLAVILGLIVIFAIGWSLGTPEELFISLGYTGGENYGVIGQMIDMILHTIYILFGLIALTILIGRIYAVIRTNK